MAAEMAAIPLRKRDADTAVLTGNFNRTKRGEKISPPPSPTMVRMKEARKMISNRRAKGMKYYFSFFESTQECSAPSPWHSLIRSGLHSPGFPFNFSGNWHLSFSVSHIVLHIPSFDKNSLFVEGA